jgi:hypothetical protein
MSKQFANLQQRYKRLKVSLFRKMTFLYLYLYLYRALKHLAKKAKGCQVSFTKSNWANQRKMIMTDTDMRFYYPALRDMDRNSKEYKFCMNGGWYIPNYKSLLTFNEKIEYLHRNYYMKSPLVHIIYNKYLAKKYISDKIGQQFVVRLLGAYEKPEDIKLDELPDSFILKAVGGAGSAQVMIIKTKAEFNLRENLQKLNKFINNPFYKAKPNTINLIAEELITADKSPAKDYKFFCVDGEVFFAYYGERRDLNDVKKISFYNVRDWDLMPFLYERRLPAYCPPPKNLEKMLDVASKMSCGLPLIRVDLYENGDRVYVGELTWHSGAAMAAIWPTEWDFKLGEIVGSVPTIAELRQKIERDRTILHWHKEITPITTGAKE